MHKKSHWKKIIKKQKCHVYLFNEVFLNIFGYLVNNKAVLLNDADRSCLLMKSGKIKKYKKIKYKSDINKKTKYIRLNILNIKTK